MLHSVKKVEYVEGYKLKLYFDDRSIKVVDLKEMLKDAKNLFVPLVDLEYFKKVKCDGTTIYWPNGVDLCPDVLYRIGIKLRAKKRSKSAKASKIRKGTVLKAESGKKVKRTNAKRR